MRLSSLLLYAVGFLILFICFYGIVNSQPQSSSAGGVWTGAPGVARTTAGIMSAAALAPPRPSGVYRLMLEREVERHNLPQNPSSPDVPSWPPQAAVKDQTRVSGVLSPQTPGLSFTGSTLADEGAFPPDCMGAVGPAQFIVAVNGRIRSFNKRTGAADGVLNVDTDVFFASVMSTASGTFTSDPRIRYDRLSGRWFIIIIDVPGGTGNGPNRILLAVSSGGTITGGTTWTFFFFQNDAVAPAGDTNDFADYPTLGIDANALYIGVNVFGPSTFAGTTGYVVRKSSILGAGPIVVTAFRGLAVGTGAGPYTPQGVDNFDPAATTGYFIGVDNATFGTLQIRRVTNPGGTPAISGNLTVTVPATNFPVGVRQLGLSSSVLLDALDDRLMSAVMRNGHIWTSHNIGLDAAGSVASPNRDGARWYEIGNLAATPSLVQSGTVFDAATPNDANQRCYFIPTIMVSGQGHAALGFSTGGANARADAATIGRLSSDAAGTMEGSPVIYTSSSTAYNPADGSSPHRWGDYSYTSVDPDDDMTLWTIQQFCDATNSYGVRAVKLIAPPPAVPSSALPPGVTTGSSNVNVSITGTSASGSGFYDPGSGFARRIAASVSGTGVTVNSVAYTDPTHVTLNLSVAGGAAAGARTITVMNPDSQQATSASAILTVTASGCPAIALAPASLPGGTAGASYAQQITASGGTAPYAFSVVAGSLPAGVTLSAGGLLSGSKPHSGTYSFTVQASDSAACTGTQAYSVTFACPSITVNPAALPDDTAGVAYSQQISATGGAGGYAFSVTSGSLPAGVTLAAGGLLSGTPTTPGASAFGITATDSLGCEGTRPYSVTIFSGPVVITAVQLTALGTPALQNFNSLASTGTGDTASLPTGWTFRETGTNANTTYTAGTGSSNTGDTYSFGAASDTDRAFGTLLSGSLTSTIGAAFKNGTGSTITSLAIAYTGEEWRLGATTGRTDSLLLQMSLDATSLSSGTWTSVPALNFATPVTSGTAGALNGNISPNRTAVSSTINGLSIPDGALFFIRWIDVNVTSSDDGLAVDDFSITPLGGSPTNPAASAGASPGTVRAGASTLLVVTVTPGTNPASSGIAVTGALDSIGGASAQTFFDDGTHGDDVAGDNRFSYLAAVGLAAAPGIQRLPVSVTDAQSRSAADTIAVTILPPCPAITLAPDTLPSGMAGSAYAETLAASGGTAPYTFTVSAGLLPQGLSLSTGGIIAGIPATAGTYSFTVTAVDTAGCSGSMADSIVIAPAPGMTVRVPLNARWNILSNPLATADSSAAALFPGHAGSAFGYNGSAYGIAPALGHGRGYWMKFTAADTASIFGLPRSADTIGVTPGWNLLGSISSPIPASALSAIGTTILSRVFAYAGSYVQADSILPGFGYWVKVDSAGFCLFGPGSPAAARNTKLPAGLNTLAVEDASGYAQTLAFGAPGAVGGDAAELFDLPPLPPDGLPDVRFAANGTLALLAPGERAPIAASSLRAPLKIRWSVTGGTSLYALDAGGTIIPMAGEGGVSLAGAPPLTLEARDRTPGAFALHQNYPNPFNPTTSIRFDLPAASRVTLAVYNVLGELVEKLLDDAPREAGMHAVTFDAGALPSGIYYYRLTALTPSAHSSVRKMMLVK